jgi:hypothetical protein
MAGGRTKIEKKRDELRTPKAFGAGAPRDQGRCGATDCGLRNTETSASLVEPRWAVEILETLRQGPAVRRLPAAWLKLGTPFQRRLRTLRRWLPFITCITISPGSIRPCASPRQWKQGLQTTFGAWKKLSVSCLDFGPCWGHAVNVRTRVIRAILIGNIPHFPSHPFSLVFIPFFMRKLLFCSRLAKHRPINDANNSKTR